MDRSNDSSGSSSSSSRRWTCEACGCNTNTESDRNCTICGTSQGSSLSRRVGYAARSGLFARSVAARRSFMQEELGMDGYELWERVDDDADLQGEEEEHAIAALAMEVAGVSGSRDPNRHRSVIEAARSFAASRETAAAAAARPDATELLRVAYENASLYQPTWMNPLQIGGRMRTGNGIELGEGDCRNVAHLPLGAGEGRALRALEAFPRSAPFASVNLVSRNNPSQDRRPRRSFGFRVAFEHPTKEAGKNMGGYYLVGVTTTSFAAFSERNALQQSPFFWGIEDCGNKYEGTRNPPSRDHRRGQASHAIELSPSEAKRNEDNVLFGSREVVTCVVDLESRSLTFWRDEELLGTLITNLPRGGSLYPVAVPYNAGSTVAITGMGGDPLPLLRSFATDWKQALKDKNDQRRKKLQAERAVLIKDRELTPKLIHTLKIIFSWYAEDQQQALQSDNPQLNLVAASRLWYRCGMKLSLLDTLMEEEKDSEDNYIEFKDFINTLERVVLDEDEEEESEGIITTGSPSFEVGDKVELVEGYERFGDAANGPLHPGERGVVIDLQEGPNGERHSVRVMHNTRRWWYQPQALVREKSGLTESPLVWFLRSILRAHGVCHTSLEPFIGTEVTASSWRVGDAVVPKKTAVRLQPGFAVPDDCEMEEIGRVMAESTNSTSSLSARGRESGSVLVEYIGRSFARGCGVQSGGSPYSGSTHETRRVPANILLHTTSQHGVAAATNDDPPAEESKVLATSDHNMEISEGPGRTSSDQLLENLKKMRSLDPSAVESIRKECENNATALATAFESGLPQSLLCAIDAIAERISGGDDKEIATQVLPAVGKLSLLIAKTTFPNANPSIRERERVANAAESPEQESLSDNEDDAPSAERRGTQRNESRSSERLERVQESAFFQDLRAQGTDRLSSVQQRRNILLALMSRARRVNPSGDALNRELRGGDGGGGPSIGHGLPPLDQFRNDAAALLFGVRGDLEDNDGDADEGVPSNENAASNAAVSSRNIHSSPRSRGGPRPESSVLDSILRGRAQKSRHSSSKTSVPSTLLRSAIVNGLLGNSLQWLKAVSQSKKPSKQSSKAGGWLKSAADEDGTPLLQLAISLGCSIGIIRFLVRLGAPVTEKEIKLAAKYELPDTLSVLLQSSVYHEGMIDLENCSPGVANVVNVVIIRQQRQQLTLRKESTSLLAKILQKLTSLCLEMRHHHEGMETCSRSIADGLIGNVMLNALQKNQKKDASSAVDSGRRSGGVKPGCERSSSTSKSQGLLLNIPAEIFAESLVNQPRHLSTFLLLVEDYLCSKDINDSAIGLSLLQFLLKRFPSFGRSAEVERFGFVELLSSHDAFASNRLAEIASNLGMRDPSVAASECPEAESLAQNGVVLCPKKHTAHLHVTLHSSFRCDLCSRGVERGRVMHGCRECDWDACERCTDEAEGGIVKWNHIRELAAECQQLLSQVGQNSDISSRSTDQKMVKLLAEMDNSSEINNLSIRLLQRDPSSIQALEMVLNTSGELTVHQFISVILPALHASLMGKPSENEESNLESILYHRNKKPRVVGATLGDTDGTMGPSSGEDKMEFARLLFHRHFLRKDGSNQDCKEDGKEDGKPGTGGENGSKPSFKSELLRRLHQVLSLYENVPALPNVHSRVGRGTSKLGELQSLTKPLQLRLTPVARQKGAQTNRKEQRALELRVEPLTSVEDLSYHLLRTCKVSLPIYNDFCRRLASESAILLERPSNCKESDVRKWRVCKVVSYNEELGCHGVRYAVKFYGLNDRRLEISNSNQQNIPSLEFDEKESNLILAVREFYIISRGRQKTSAFDMDQLLTDEIVPNAKEEDSPSLRAATRGSRVESNLGRDYWKPCTVLSVKVDETDERRYTVVTDDGEVFSDIPEKSVRGLLDEENDSEDEGMASRVESRRGGRDGRGQISRSFPFMSTRRDAAEGRSQPAGTVGVMKRAWSALSLTEAMRPVELAVPDSSKVSKPRDSVGFSRVRTVRCTIDDQEIDVCIERAALELPPVVRVRFSIGTTPTPAGSHTQSDVTLISLLSHLYQKDNKKLFSGQVHEVSYSMSCERYHERMIPVQSTMKVDDSTSTKAAKALACRSPSPEAPHADMMLTEEVEPQREWEQVSRSRKFNHLTTYAPGGGDVCSREICQGLDEICIQCMEIISLLAVLADKTTDASEKKNDAASILFANPQLSKKLTEQLDDPLHVAGGLLPSWCFKGPCFSPRTFSYQSRKLLLERAAFGVSRSTLRQQESKVKDVGRFRQRMASLRARAVELVGEAFSGGAEDPTALQLQADELYGMEEALAAKVKANFRAAKWEEHALQVAKAAVNRDLLIADAVSIMDQYANDGSLSRRRLEVRFDGESGFDAAAGDEAGVTRGFYADVAEALLSCDIVSGVGVASFCEPGATVTTLLASNSKGLPCKLPLWIPDVDASNHVIIPTPRADPTSGIGVYPRPLSSLHPQIPVVMEQFRFMGRLFASSMRDGFMLPLPLSTSFLKLVLNCQYDTNVRSNGESGMMDEEIAASASVPVATSLALTSNDLPRPGFLGGEVHAAEMHICRALDRLDQMDPPLSRDELESKYMEIATDKSFARSAMGKTFDCSFEDYFQDRTFVDPLDPEQGVGAFPLCANGHARNVTIHNIREWVALAKEFILNDGVMAQAMAFRRGVEDFFSADFLRLFTPEELQSDVCGVGDNVDSWTEADVRKLFKLDGGKGAAEALVAVAAIGGEGGAALSRRFGPSSPTIGFVVKALLEATPKMRRQFLSFVTSVPIVTPGKIEVVPVVSPSGEFLPMRDPTCLPRANTCARRLYLPKFETFESFKQVLWAVVSEESKFKGFYEWRG